MPCWSTPSSPWNKTGRFPNGVAASGKNLTTIYATHGHGDHFFGVNTIQHRFPNARFIASREAISVMREQLSPPWLEAYWKSGFLWADRPGAFRLQKNSLAAFFNLKVKNS